MIAVFPTPRIVVLIPGQSPPGRVFLFSLSFLLINTLCNLINLETKREFWPYLLKFYRANINIKQECLHLSSSQASGDGYFNKTISFVFERRSIEIPHIAAEAPLVQRKQLTKLLSAAAEQNTAGSLTSLDPQLWAVCWTRSSSSGTWRFETLYLAHDQWRAISLALVGKMVCQKQARRTTKQVSFRLRRRFCIIVIIKEALIVSRCICVTRRTAISSRRRVWSSVAATVLRRSTMGASGRSIGSDDRESSFVGQYERPFAENCLDGWMGKQDQSDCGRHMPPWHCQSVGRSFVDARAHQSCDETLRCYYARRSVANLEGSRRNQFRAVSRHL